MMGEIIQGNFQPSQDTTQRVYWEGRLEDAERAVKVAKHMLRLLVDPGDKFDIFPDDVA